jgi:hypothetical protein
MAHSNGALEAPSNVIWVVAKEKLRELKLYRDQLQTWTGPGGTKPQNRKPWSICELNLARVEISDRAVKARPSVRRMSFS